MEKRLLQALLISGAAVLPAMVCAEVLDFARIVHWTGEGENEAALVVQFDEPAATDPGAIVWGYRWPKDETRTSEQMIRDIAKGSADLVVMTQYTGGMGSTLDGIGYSPDVNAMLEGVWFDYDAAVEDGNISFGYIYPNTGMGQTVAPGGAARDLAYDAIAAAAETHVIEHPLNQREYGYPAYDYDHWKFDKSRVSAAVGDLSYWRAGWYDRYWSFWIGSRGDNLDDLSYSGMGMSSVNIYDGQISGWKCQPLNGKPIVPGEEPDGMTGASTRWGNIAYKHVFMSSESTDASADSDIETMAEIFTLGGQCIGRAAVGADMLGLGLDPGIYVVRQGSKATKLLIN